MDWLSDETLERLRAAAHAPDLWGTRYRVLGEVGRGGMGSVFLAEDTALERRVALKVLDVPDARGDLAERLVREARILARLEHPGIVPVHDVGLLADGRVFYAMKYVEGRRLDQWTATEPALPERLRLFQRICEAVAFAHDRGVLHRDLKPENVMVGPFGEVLVLDWGVAKLLDAMRPRQEATPARDATASTRRWDDSTQTAHGVVLGTPGYMAPEQARGEVDHLDARADVWSLGALLLTLLTGRAPRDATTITKGRADPLPTDLDPERSNVPRALRAVSAKAMAWKPEDRYPSAIELAADVARYLDGRRVEAYSEGFLQRAARLYAGHKVAFWLILTYLMVRGTILIFVGR